MKESKFLLEKEFKEALNFETFPRAKQAYLKAMMESKFKFEGTTNIFKLIENVKRKPETIGPYKDLTPFEALNRIGSDLVLLVGAEKLFKGENGIKAETIKLEMGNQNGFDLIIHEKHTNEKILGEAFNVAESFCILKYSTTIKKLLKELNDNTTKYQDKKLRAAILVNAEREDILRSYTNKKEQEYKDKLDVTIIYCKVGTLERVRY